MDSLARDKGYRHSVDRKLRAAGRLLQSALVDLGGIDVPDIPSELDRRDLVMLCRAIGSLCFDLTVRLSSLAALDLIKSFACPHCGWSRPCLKDGTCPRCQGLREAYRADARKGQQTPVVVEMAYRRGQRDRG
jgi:hypothetical protein